MNHQQIEAAQREIDDALSLLRVRALQHNRVGNAINLILAERTALQNDVAKLEREVSDMTTELRGEHD